MLRAILLISAVAIPVSGVLAQNRPEPIKTSGFIEVKPSGKPFATAPVRSAAATPDRVPNARRTPLTGAETILPPDEEPATQDTPDAGGGRRVVTTTQSQPQQTVQVRRTSSPSDPSADPDDPDKEQDTGDKEPSDEGTPDSSGGRPPAAGGQPTEED